MRVKSNAKINISLSVKRKLDNGFHEVKIITLPVSLHDVLYIKKSKENRVFFKKDQLVDQENNLVYKAILAFKEKTGCKYNFTVKIDKRIPNQAGLGGGSSNAAFTLVALNKICKTKLTNKELEEIGLPLGSDVPFFINNLPAVAKGIGERLTNIFVLNKYHVLLVKPQKGLSTKQVYELYDTVGNRDAHIHDVVIGLEAGNEKLIAKTMFNSLEAPAISLLPEIKEIKDYLMSKGLNIVLMSGSGSTVFALSLEKGKLKRIYNELKDKYECYLCKVIKKDGF